MIGKQNRNVKAHEIYQVAEAILNSRTYGDALQRINGMRTGLRNKYKSKKGFIPNGEKRLEAWNNLMELYK